MTADNICLLYSLFDIEQTLKGLLFYFSKFNHKKGDIMKKVIYFSVYEHTLVIHENQLISRKFIVLKNSENQIVAWTDFHKYISAGKRKYARKISDDGNKRHYYVAKLLNYAFFDRYKIKSLRELNPDIVKNFLNEYGMGMLPDDVNSRTETTVEVCIRTILDFIESLYSKNKDVYAFKLSEFYKVVEVRNKHGRIIKKNVPSFDIRYVPSVKQIFRDMPESVFTILMDLIIHKHKDILILVALSAFGGLRPSECCNVRRQDSKLGPGIMFSMIDGEIQEIKIDLRKELNLRSDLKNVGTIKKERVQKIYPAFQNAFYDCYKIYMQHIEGRKYESEYGALTVNKQGKAMTYNSYYRKFKVVISELIPLLLNSNDSEAVNYAFLLQENNISPHIFRHWFSVKLTLFGEDVSGLMFWRGDKSPESALTYLQNKSDLEKQYTKVNNEIFNYNMWCSEKYKERKNDRI